MGGRYGYGGGRLPEPYVPEVVVPNQADLEGKALANALRMGQLDEVGQDLRGKRAYSDALARVLTEGQALDDISRQGHGAWASAMRGTVLQRQKQTLENAEIERNIFAKLRPTIVDQGSLDSAVGYWEAITGRRVPDELRRFTPDLPGKLDRMYQSSMTPEQQERLRLAQNNDARAQAQENRDAGLYQGRVEGQGLENQGRALMNQGRQAELDAMDEGYALPGNRFLSTQDALKAYHDARTKNLDPEFTFEKYISGFKPASRNKKTGAITVDEQAPPNAGQAPSGGQGQGGGDQPPVSGAKKAPDGNWYVQQNGKWFRVN